MDMAGWTKYFVHWTKKCPWTLLGTTVDNFFVIMIMVNLTEVLIGDWRPISDKGKIY